eukprot:3560449-Lingulodinium_polyedra.AAC.1
MLQDGQLLLVPPDLHLTEYPAWHLASSAAHQLFGFSIDGVLYGHSIKNFPCVVRSMYGILLVWSLSDRNKYVSMEVVPARGTTITPPHGLSWDTCAAA